MNGTEEFRKRFTDDTRLPTGKELVDMILRDRNPKYNNTDPQYIPTIDPGSATQGLYQGGVGASDPYRQRILEQLVGNYGGGRT